MVKSLVISFLIVLLPYGPLLAAETPASPEYVRANKLFASSRYREALSLYQQLLAAPPKGVTKADIQARIGDTWFRLGSYTEALQAYRDAIFHQKESKRPETQYWIGFCCFLLGRDAEAAREFLVIPEHYPGSGMWVGTAYYWAGRACERMGKKDEAAAYYRKAAGKGKSTQSRFAMKRADAVNEANVKSQKTNPK